MATFKVGQRVKKVARMREEDSRPELKSRAPTAPMGAEGIVRGFRDDGALRVEFYGYPSDGRSTWWRVFAYQLAPLTDPAADAFLESIRKMKPYEEPTFKERTRELQERAFKS